MKPGATDAGLAVLMPFLRRMAQHRGWLALGLLLSCVSLFASLGLLGLSGGFLTATAIAGLTVASAQAFNYFLPAAGVRFFAMTRTAGRWAERVSTHEATFRLIGALRVWLYGVLARLSPAQLGLWHGADLLGNLTRDIDALDNLYQRLLLPSLAAALIVATLAGVFLWQAPALLPVWLAFGACALIFLPWTGWRLGRRAATPLVTCQAHVRRELLNGLDGLEDYALHAPAWRNQRQRIATADAARIGLQVRLASNAAALRAAMLFAVGLALWAALGVLNGLPAERMPDGPWLAVILMLILASLEAVQHLPQAWLELPGTAASAARLQALDDLPPAPAFPVAGPLPRDASVEFEGVSFWHDPAHRLFDRVSLHIPAGSHVAIVGPSGEGKTSLLNLVARLCDPQEGEIRLGGQALRSLDETALRRHVAYAPQDVWLMTATLADNLRLARPDADDAVLWSILDVVGLRDTVAAWPEGLATWIEEGGASLSGGQRRRLGVARTLLRNAPITLLDEPTEGLDPAAVQALIARVRHYLRGKTLLWVSHRSVGRTCFDQVLSVENGRIDHG